jgi:cellulose synthase/poly-beta-1,6-N-acetylglucosamine synthase-like glycosyltransferase/peptidoglycan/xylan/chitin deacetylase (PgdA/CDA1 family)/spore germination protein YaaH
MSALWRMPDGAAFGDASEMLSKPAARFVFLDPSGRRWPRFRRVMFWSAILLAFASILFVNAVWIRPALRLPAMVRELKGRLKAEANKPGPDAKAENWQRYLEDSRAGQERMAHLREQLTGRKGDDVRLGFYVDWDANSMASLRAHVGELTHIAPEWFTISGVDSTLIADPDPALGDFCAAHGLKTVPLLRNLVGDDWQPEAVEALARADAARQRSFAASLAEKLREFRAAGVLLDFNELDPALAPQFTTLFHTLADTLHAEKLELWLAVSMDDEIKTYDLDSLSPFVDRFVALLFDEHTTGDTPGPIASQQWCEGWLRVAGEQGEPRQWIVALGTHGHDWNTTTGTMDTISFRDAMTRASYAGADTEGDIAVTAPSYNGHFDYADSDGDHDVWFLDAVSFHDQIRAVRTAGVRGVGLSRLGTEDPAIWSVLARTAPVDDAFLTQLEPLKTDQTITHVGRGEVVSVDMSRDDGFRNVVREADGNLGATYTDAPTYSVLYHQGAADKAKVALTFDDGPDPVWTPRILDVLKARGAKATFFVVGRNAEDHPDLVRRIVAEGHEIGNHTYTHSNIAEMPEWRQRLELSATERLIEAETGRSTTLFRPPYNADATPSDVSELAPLDFAERELGYTVVMEAIDPQDWARPGADVILQRVKEQRRGGNIILLHDAGGDRSQTLAALPRILDWLTERGDAVVPISELIGIPHEEIMPRVESDAQSGWRAVAGVGFRVWRWIVETLWAFMLAATALVVARSLLLGWLAWRQKRMLRRQTPVQIESWPAVSVLIAAYNEGKVVAKTLRSVLDCDYSGVVEVVIVDDGSRDETAAECQRIAAEDGRVRVFSQTNAGKPAALHRALAEAQHEIVVFLDADTQFERGTIRKLVSELTDERFGAVAGHARVGNRHNFLTRCQALEYICGFNLDRRAYTAWNCVTVVPGAVSAFRRAAINEAGGFSHDTLAEDTDMTLTLHRLGWRIGYAPEAIAWTEAPETWRALVTQRVRWAFGTMQCLWKHRDLTFDPRRPALGFFALPSAWFFHVALVAIVPLADAMLLWSLIVGYASSLWPYFMTFLAVDLLLATLACALDGVPLRRAWLIVPMRFAYRWLLAWVMWKSILRAVRGALVGWGKVDRTGTVAAPIPQRQPAL